MDSIRVFVTGGSGFIGMRLVRTLLEAGHEVVCLSRSGKTSARLAGAGAEVLSGDLSDAVAVRSCVREARPTHVVHLAAEASTQRNRARIERVNVRGTEALLKACRDLEGLAAFLFLSSVVRGDAGGQVLSEADVIPATTAHGRSKEIGDAMVLRAHTEWGVPAVVLRPSHVYGPGGWLADLVHDRFFRIPGKGDNLWDVVHVDDVVSACMLLLEKRPAGEVFHVVDDEPVTMNAFFDHVAAALHRKRFGHAPVWLVKLLRGAGPVMAAVRSARSNNGKLKELGWTPAYPSSSTGVRAAIAELRQPKIFGSAA